MVAINIMSPQMSWELPTGSRIQASGLKNLTGSANTFALRWYFFLHCGLPPRKRVFLWDALCPCDGRKGNQMEKEGKSFKNRDFRA